MLSRLLLLVSLFALLIGCGGNNPRNGPTSIMVNPHLSVAWPERSRAFDAPSSALSVVAVLYPLSGVGPGFAFGGDRPESNSAQTETVTSLSPIEKGSYSVEVQFYSQKGGVGSVVATARAVANVLDDGSMRLTTGPAFDSIELAGQIGQIFPDSLARVEVGQTKAIGFTALSTSGAVMAVAPGAEKVQLVSGGEALLVNHDSTVTGLRPGTARIVLSVDGISSGETDVTVDQPMAVRSFDFYSTALIADSKRGLLWLTTPATEPNGNRMISLNSTTGEQVTSLAVGSDPNLLAISDDSSRMYVGLRGAGAVVPVNLSSGAVGTPISLSSDLGGTVVATDIDVQPGHPGTFAVTSASINSSGTFGPSIYDGALRRPNFLGVYQGTQMAWVTPDRLISYNGSHTGAEAFGVTVDADGATITETKNEAFGPFTQWLSEADGRVFGSDGTVIDATTLNRVGSFPAVPSLCAPVVDTEHGLVFFISLSDAGAKIETFDLHTYAKVSQGTVTLVPGWQASGDLGNLGLCRIGATGLAFRMPNRLYLIGHAPGMP